MRTHVFRHRQPGLPRPDHRLRLLPATAAGAPVSTSLTWADLAATIDSAVHDLFTVPERTADGDPWAGIDEVALLREPLLAFDEESGPGEMNVPPDHPKMPGEPPRVQPSKKVAVHWDEEGKRVE